MSMSLTVRSFTTSGAITFELRGETPEDRALLRSFRNGSISFYHSEEQKDSKGPYTPVLSVVMGARSERKKK